MSVPQSIKVLIAEDDFLVAREIKRILNDTDYEVVGEASNGLKAVQMTATLRPDVVLMDIEMPRLDGLEAARRIQESCPTPVVVLTAHESRELVEKASETGVGAYLTKPPAAAEIGRAIAIAIARHGDLMETRRLYEDLRVTKEELEKQIAEVKILRGFLPICAQCKKIRDDKGYWDHIESYIQKHSEANFTHGICPECTKKLYPELKL